MCLEHHGGESHGRGNQAKQAQKLCRKTFGLGSCAACAFGCSRFQSTTITACEDRKSSADNLGIAYALPEAILSNGSSTPQQLPESFTLRACGRRRWTAIRIDRTYSSVKAT